MIKKQMVLSGYFPPATSGVLILYIVLPLKLNSGISSTTSFNDDGRSI